LNRRIKKIKEILKDKKGQNIEVVDLRLKEYIVDYVVLTSTLNSKHSFALLNYLKKDLKPFGEEFLRIEQNDEWTVIDLGDIFIHLMSEKAREKYSLEEFLSQVESRK